MKNTKEYNSVYYQINKDNISLYKKEYWLKTYKSSKKIYTEEEKLQKQIIKKENRRIYTIEYRRKNRELVIKLLGSKCLHCGFNDIRALQIDHVNGGGSSDRKNNGNSGFFYNNVIKSINNQENKYQLLCANCNWIKRVVNKE